MDFSEEADKWDSLPTPAYLWWAITYASEVMEDITISTGTGRHRTHFEKRFKILGYTFNQAGRTQGCLEERMQHANKACWMDVSIDKCTDVPWRVKCGGEVRLSRFTKRKWTRISQGVVQKTARADRTMWTIRFEAAISLPSDFRQHVEGYGMDNIEARDSMEKHEVVAECTCHRKVKCLAQPYKMETHVQSDVCLGQGRLRMGWQRRMEVFKGTGARLLRTGEISSRSHY